FFSAVKTPGSVITSGTRTLFNRSQGRFAVPRDTSSASVRRRCGRLATALAFFACAWSVERAGVAHAQSLITLSPAPPPSSEFLLHASPDNIQEIATRHGLTIVRTLDVPPYDVFLVQATSASTSGTGTD